MSERGWAHISERENSCWRSSLCLWVLLLPLVLILSLRKLQGFSFMVYPRINLCVYCLFWLIVVHVILSDNILISYCLNDKNITYCWMFHLGIGMCHIELECYTCVPILCRVRFLVVDYIYFVLLESLTSLINYGRRNYFHSFIHSSCTFNTNVSSGVY